VVNDFDCKYECLFGEIVSTRVKKRTTVILKCVFTHVIYYGSKTTKVISHLHEMERITHIFFFAPPYHTITPPPTSTRLKL
jgi:hypothetical protein